MTQTSALENRISEQERLITQLRREVAVCRRDAGIAEANARYLRSLFESLDTGLCIVETAEDDAGRLVDCCVLDVNSAFERQSGLTHPVGRGLTTLFPDDPGAWLDMAGEIARTGTARRFDAAVALLGRRYDVYGFEAGAGRVGMLFTRASAASGAQEAHRLKDRFLATLAHELRNPMAPIQSGLEVLRLTLGDPARNPEDVQHVLTIMHRQMDHLRHLMDELLDVSRIDRGLIELATQPLDLVDAVRQALQQCGTALHGGHREVSVALPAGPLMINGDRQRAVQLVAGILDNAAKFTADNGRIDVVVSQSEGHARVVVRDDGVGIEADMLSEIFGMFSQANTDRHGLGVGLTVVRNLVELHGGTVVARSAGRGRGSEFQVDLPLAESVGSDRADDAGGVTAQASGRRRVLVVDDNRDAADSLTVLLAAMGEDTQTAYDGPSALLLLDEFQPGVVFLDLGMPEMDGFEVARRIRARHGPEEVTLVAVTGWGQVADRERVTAAGFDGHLVKPASYEDLRSVCQLRDRQSL